MSYKTYPSYRSYKKSNAPISCAFSLPMENETISQGRIENMGVLNLLSAKSAEEFAFIERIANVGAVLVPRSLAMALAKVPMENVGSVVPVPEDEDMVVISGQTMLTGEAIAAGDPERSLLIVGQVFVTTRIEKVGYKGVHVVGQLIATRGSEAALTPVLRNVTGQVLFAPPDARLVLGEGSCGLEFLEALGKPTSFVVFGELRFEDDVDVELLRRVVPEIVLFGVVNAPKRLLPTLQVLTVEKFGEIVEG